MDILGDGAIKPLADMVTGLGKTAENLAEDRNTTRLRIDSTSLFKLPQLIRPLMAIVFTANEVILTLATILIVFFTTNLNMEGMTALAAALTANSGILGTIITFYFKSRKEEKLAAKNASAHIILKEMELEAELYREEILLKEEVKDNKAERKKRNPGFVKRVLGTKN